MMDHSLYQVKQPVIAVVGPTASGKSNLAQELALKLNGEVLSADSMQVYRGMEIGTAKIKPEERKVPHWGIDLINPGEPYSAALFQEYARRVISALDKEGKRTILAGGTGLYVRAALDDYDFPEGEQIDNPIRDKYTAYAQEFGNQALWNLLNEIDAESASVIHPNNVRRVVRAFELLSEGKTYAQQKENLSSISQLIPAIFIGLKVSPDLLNERINRRVDSMIRDGLVDEVKSLLSQGFREGVTAPQAIGYKEIVQALEGECTLEEAIDAIKTASRRYAKRQRTWFNKDKRIQWIDIDNTSSESLLNEALEVINEHDSGAFGDRI